MSSQPCSYSGCEYDADYKATIVYDSGESLEPHYVCMTDLGVYLRLVDSIYYTPPSGWSWSVINLLDFPEED